MRLANLGGSIGALEPQDVLAGLPGQVGGCPGPRSAEQEGHGGDVAVPCRAVPCRGMLVRRRRMWTTATIGHTRVGLGRLRQAEAD